MLKIFTRHIFSITKCDYNKLTYDKNLHKVFSKKDFFEKFPDYEPFKVMKSSMIHNDYKYNFGLNKIVNYNPNGECSEGGFYLCDKSEIHNYAHYGENIASVSLPDNALIYLEKSKIKVSELYLDKIIDMKTFFNNCSNQEQLLYVKDKQFILRYIDNQTDEICELAIQQHYYALHYIKNQTSLLSKIAVQQNGLALRYVKEQTEEICKFAVQRNGLALQYVKEQTEEICKLAVQQNGLALKYVQNQTDEICILAVQQSGLAFAYVQNKTDEICSILEEYKLEA